ncbi:MAG: SAM-dependent chlorinase/fluorinase [Bacteroidetes bacterium]|nr:SAM-dependent chlorinase/fluorinase [Bacteroidota bacterium]
MEKLSDNLPIITLTTDFGIHSHFVAELKGKLLNILPNCKIIDITHSINPFQLIETSFILKNSIFHYPPQTIHAVGVDSSLELYKSLIIAKCKNQFIIAANNGILPMVLNGFEYNYKNIEIKQDDYFSFKNIFPHYIKSLIENNFDLEKLPGENENILKLVMQKPVFSGNIITFNIIYIDNFGNAYTNLTRDFFEDVVGNKKFIINLSKFESVSKIHTNYNDVSEGEKVCFFDENGYMVIAINRGRANKLLGFRLENNQFIIELI